MIEQSTICDVAIVGGGIAGLSTAWYLQQEAAAAGVTMRCVLLEGSERLGGHVRTETVDRPEGRFIVEAGPDAFITSKPWGVQLARELGMEHRLLGTNDQMRKVYVLNRGKPTPMPDGVLLIVPTRFRPFIFSPLISPLGKLRMGLDLLIPAKRDDDDETLADFIRRRLGSEALDKIAEPLLSGIYNSEAEKQSILATFPRFRELEKRYGSLTRGMLESRRAAAPGPSVLPSSAKRLPTFMSLRGGTGELAQALADRVKDIVRLGERVASVAHCDEGGYRLTTSLGRVVEASIVVLAVPAFVAESLLGEIARPAARGLAQVRYVSTGTVSVAYRLSDIRRPLSGFGLVVPHSERRPVNAVTWSSQKFDGRAPEGYALLRVFFGGSRSPQSMSLGDDELLATIRSQLAEFMGIEAEPVFHRIFRQNRSNAQYDVGHLGRVTEIEAALPEGIFLTGSPYRGVGLPDCIKQGHETALKIVSSHQSIARRNV